MIETTKQFIIEVQRQSKAPVFSPIYNYCQKALQELNRPLRIAISGMIKTGKSTLLNAFLERDIVPTAVEVMTYNVNWFHHIKYSPDGTECFIVHYLNGDNKQYPLNEIASFVGYSAERQELIDSIHYVDAYIDNPLLERFDLIDTPGLNSLLGTDSQHTKDLLTKDENRPDAIIYLISGEFQSRDLEDVFAFNQSTGLLSGINSIAAITRVDEMENYYKTAQDIIDTNKERYAEIRYNFSDIYAIAALPALAAVYLTDKEILMLKELSSQNDVATLLSTREYFARSTWQDSETRKSLLKQLSIEGIRLVTNYFVEHPLDSVCACRTYLTDFSKVKHLQQMVVGRFGERSDFYKSNIAISGLRKVCNTLVRNVQIVGSNRQQLQHIQMMINQYELVLHQQYADYYLLNDYYNQETYFDEDDWERIKCLLGENGKEDYQCLGLPSTATSEQIVLQYEAELAYWKKKANLALVMNNHTRHQSAKQIIDIITNKLNNHKS